MGKRGNLRQGTYILYTRLINIAGSHRVLRRAAVDLPEPLDDAPHHLLPVPLLRRPRRHLELGLQTGHSIPLRFRRKTEKAKVSDIPELALA